jgi:hypothetical protein
VLFIQLYLFELFITSIYSLFSLLVIASIKIDDGSMKFFLYLVKCGILESICNDQYSLTAAAAMSSETAAGYASDESLGEGSVTGFPGTTNNKESSNPPAKSMLSKSHRQQSMMLTRAASTLIPEKTVASGNTIDLQQIHKLQDTFYNQITLIGWLVRLNNLKVLQFLLKKFSIYYNYLSPIDAKKTLPFLHYLAVNGNTEVFDLVLHVIQSINTMVETLPASSSSSNSKEIHNHLLNSINNSGSSSGNTDSGITMILGNTSSHAIPDVKRILMRYESYNALHETPFMLASKHSNFQIIKKFFQLKVNLRNALNGKYAAWVLAFVKRLESKEKLTQTGRYGSDDELYFNLDQYKEFKNLPIYYVWSAY